jgi:hypothetical protein
MTMIWHDCYNDTWKGFIIPDAYAHPAKFSRGLITRILSFGLEQGFWTKGQTILDPFAGIGTGGIIAASHSIGWLGVELEPKFVTLASRNFDLHRHTWQQFGDPLPHILQGDSRYLAQIIQDQAHAVLSSPPYSDERVSEFRNFTSRFGDTKNASKIRQADYGTTPGQFGAMPQGSLDAAVSSPPYERGIGEGCTYRDAEKMARENQRPILQEKRTGLASYGMSNGQLGQVQGATFWSAARLILLQCHAVLKPSAITAWVVKDFVRNKTRQNFTSQWTQLLEATGFIPFLEVHASLVKTTRHKAFFGDQVKTRERKSFFRRLAEKKGSPVIDHESILFARKV